MKILVVDDSTFIKSLITKTLQNSFPTLELLGAGNGREGYDLYRSHQPDLVITDLLMPEMDGWELLRLIREENKQVKLVVFSADVQKATEEEVEQFGITAFIRKPFNNEKAEQLIRIVKGEFNA